ncbi:MAG: hypothetical protein ACP5RC_12180, partial [Halothiobacillaceae bacterium]
RAENLKENEALQVAIELSNPATSYAAQIQTADHHLIGWAPRYLANDLLFALCEHSTVTATVKRVNRLDAPFARRVIVELCGGVSPSFEPMASDEYRVISI